MLLNQQTDQQWSNDIMAMPTDYIYQYGCVITCLANILNITPRDLNQTLKKFHGYMGLTSRAIKGRESYINWDVLPLLFGLSFNSKQIFSVIQLPDLYFIRYEKHRIAGTQHYCNIIFNENGMPQIFDVSIGDIRPYVANKQNPCYELIKE